MQPAVLAAEGMTVRHAGAALFAGLGVEVGPGALLEVSGANGSGKTTLLRALGGLLEPDEGAVRWRGAPIYANLGGFFGELAYVGHKNAVNPRLGALDNLRLAAALGGGGGGLADALAKLGGAELAGEPAGALSAGQLRRVSLARLLLSPARLWLLDEPLANLDAAGCRAALAVLREHLDGGGVAVVSTHRASQWPGAVQRLELRRA